MTNDNYYPRPHFVLVPLKEGQCTHRGENNTKHYKLNTTQE